MPNLKELCLKNFGKENFYEIFNVSQNANLVEIKKSYHHLSLKFHPDKVNDEKLKREATQKFQIISSIYSLLSDKQKRKLYDETGLAEDSDFDSQRDWFEYWKTIFKKITIEDIRNFEAQYKGSKEERKDVIDAYMTYKGDIQKIMDNIMCSDQSNDVDEDRYKEIIDKELVLKNIPEFKAYKSEGKQHKTKRKLKAAKEANEAKKLAEELFSNETCIDGDEQGLTALIAKRQDKRKQEMNHFLDNIESKYVKSKSTKIKSPKKLSVSSNKLKTSADALKPQTSLCPKAVQRKGKSVTKNTKVVSSPITKKVAKSNVKPKPSKN